MLLLRTLAPCLLLACLAQQVALSVGSGKKERKGKGNVRALEQSQSSAPVRAGKGGKAPAAKGKFSTKDKMQCTWVTRGEGTVTLAVTCQNPEAKVKGGVTELSCTYTARPISCPGYDSNPDGYWKQVARALKKLQKKLCADSRAQVKTGMCKRAPQDAHFKLSVDTIVALAQQPDETARQVFTPRPMKPAKAIVSTTTTTTKVPNENAVTAIACTERVDQKKIAEEYCSSTWVSLCAFFFSMVQSGDC
ncbi:fibroblast growth factor-binding protein 1-like [Aplochiton taeniatus]